MHRYIFIDTFALSALTREHSEKLTVFLRREDLTIIITSMLLVEYFSPN